METVAPLPTDAGAIVPESTNPAVVKVAGALLTGGEEIELPEPSAELARK
jgi:hypothetical protein